MTVDETKLRSSTDARIWAKEFMAEFGAHKQDIDVGLMTGWFANAMITAELLADKHAFTVKLRPDGRWSINCSCGQLSTVALSNWLHGALRAHLEDDDD